MDIQTILRVLKNSGFNVLGADSAYIYLEDPACVLRSFSTFVEYAWIIISTITLILMFGWGISMIRGAKNDIITNIRNLLIMFATLSIAGPIIDALYGDALFARGCRSIKVSISDVNQLMDARKSKLKEYDPNMLYEEIEIYDSGAINADTPYSESPLSGAGTPMEIDGDGTNPTADEFGRRFGGSRSSSQNFADTGDGTGDDTENADDTPPQDNDINATEPEPDRQSTSGRGQSRNARPSAQNYSDTTSASAHAERGTKNVIYVNADGTKYRRVGGTRAWRNKNPGNIRYSDFSRRMGAIGEAGNFAVFPDEETGRNAIKALLRTDTYSRLTIAGAISRYAPPSENNTAGYHRRIQELTGLSINRRVQDLSDSEIARVASAIEIIEGWKVGEIEIL